MPRLINRNKQVPGGMKFYCPFLKWSSPPWASFAVICDGLRNARLANPGVTKANNLATDANQIAEEVDAYVAANCEALGQTDYITGAGGAAVPFPQGAPNRPVRKVQNLAAGAEVVVEWIASGAEAVPIEQATQRAEVCSRCPLNEQGDWSRWFTEKASDAIRAMLNRKRELKLETPFDDKLGTCAACDCPMALKVWLPLEKFLPKMTPAAKAALHPACWLTAESKEPGNGL